MKHLLLIVILYSNLNAQNKPQELPADSLLISSLVKYYEAERVAQIKPYEIEESKKWIKYLPSVGLAYNLQGQPRPSFSYSPLSILESKKSDKLRDAAKEAVLLNYDLLISDRVEELKAKIREYKLKLELYDMRLEVIELDLKLYEIEETKYEEDLIKPSEYIRAKKSIHQAKMDAITILYDITELYHSIILTSKFNLQTY